MTYFKCKWNHAHGDEPVLMYSELDEERWETRKVEIFRDGKMGFANRETESGGSRLGLPCVAWSRIVHGRRREILRHAYARQGTEAVGMQLPHSRVNV